MSFLARFDKNIEQNSSDMLAESENVPNKEPGFFTGVTDLKQIGNTIDRGMLLDPLLVGSLAASNVPRLIDKVAGTDFTDAWHENVTDPLIRKHEEWKPDPVTHGTAVQILDSLGTLVPQAIATGALGTGVLSGIPETATEISKGKDLKTATELGAITGITNAAGIIAPGAVGGGAMAKILSGAGINLAFNDVSDRTREAVLRDGGYIAEADAVKESANTNRLIAIALGAAFGGLAHVTERTQGGPSEQSFLGVGVHATEDYVPAAMVANQLRTIHDQMPGLPVSPKVKEDFVKTFDKNTDAVINGDPIQSKNMDGFINDPVKPVESIDEFIPPVIERSTDYIETLRSQIGSLKYNDSLIESFVEQGVGKKRELKKALDKYQKGRDLTDKEAVNVNFALNHIQKTNSNALTAGIKDLSKSVDIIDAFYNKRNFNKAVETYHPEFQAALPDLKSLGDSEITYNDETGTTVTKPASELLSEIDQELVDLPNIKTALQDAITCFLRFGERY